MAPPATAHPAFEDRALGARVCTFDVICAGDALLHAALQGAPGGTTPSLDVRPGGGAVSAALAVAGQGLRVGLASVLSDDTSGRALRARILESGVDVGGVELGKPRPGLLFVRGGARQLVSTGDEAPAFAVPEGWSSRVLLLSGMSPVVSHGAALCKAARAARRVGTLVVVDVNADWSLWRGRDPRSVRMVLREADVVSCSAQDLFGLDMSVPSLRAALRPSAVLVLRDGAGRASATGPFGEVAHALGGTTLPAPLGQGDAFNAAICSELARAGRAGDGGGDLWARVLARAHAAVVGQARR